jgi:hypothetical protein
MEPSELDKLVASFKAKLKPVTKEEMEEAGLPAPTPEEVEAAGPPPWEEKPEEEVAIPVPMGCITNEFRGLIRALPDTYIGHDGHDIKDLVEAFLDTLPACKE